MMNQFGPININEPALIDAHPTFKRFAEGVFIKSPIQRKYLSHHFAQRDPLFWRRAEKFAIATQTVR